MIIVFFENLYFRRVVYSDAAKMWWDI